METVNITPINKYVLLYPDDMPVGLDRDSGGYPYAAQYLNQIKYWDDYDAAYKYSQMFGRQHRFRIARVKNVELELIEV